MSTPVPSCPRVAIIGVSGYGRIHLNLARDAQARGELQLVAAVIINVDEEAALVAELRSTGCVIYDDYKLMLKQEAPRLDLCLVPTGIHWHARMTLEALRHGVNVLVEKPLCASLAEADGIRRAEAESGKFVAVGFQDLYEPGTLWLKDALVKGCIGRIKSVRFLGLWPRSRDYFLRNEWAGSLTMGEQLVLDSPLNNAFGHFVLLSLFFADPRAREAATVRIKDAELFRGHAIESFDSGVVRSTTREGVDLWFGASHACRDQVEPLIKIEGTQGSACWHYEKEAWWETSDGKRELRPLLDVDGARQAMIRAVLNRLHDNDTPICSTALAIRHTAFIETLHDVATIRDFAPERLNWGSDKSSLESNPGVRDLARRMKQAHAAGETLSSNEYQWVAASPSTR